MIRVTALLLTFATGFAGLVYEVTWQRYLATLLGSHGEATAAVLAIFLGGLAAGYALFGRVTQWSVARAGRDGRSARLLYLYALVEGGIGLYALAFPILFSVAQQVSLQSPAADALGFGFDVVLSALLIGPATVLMGGTIPILTLALAGDLAHATRVHAWVYGVNTLGAFAGALGAAYWLIPWLGLDSVLYTMGCVNLVAAAIFAQLDRGASSVAPDWLQTTTDPGLPIARFAGWAAVALLAGFGMMALQTTFNRVAGLALGASQFTFAMVAAVFVLCIALGSLAVSAFSRIPRGLIVGSQFALVALLIPLYLAIADITYWAYALRVMFQPADPAFYVHQLALFGALVAILIVPISLAGALLPLLFHLLRREIGDLGAVAGRLYAWNTVGSLLGALLGGYVLLFWLDLHHIYRLAVVVLAVGAVMLLQLVMRLPRVIPALVLIPIVAVIALLPPWPVDRMTAGLFRGRSPSPISFLGPEAFYSKRLLGSILFYDDDPTATVSVLEPPAQPENRGIVVNGKSDGALEGDYVTMALTALLPALMAEKHERCFVIGLGTGVTAGQLAALDNTAEVQVAEISRGVIAANPLFDAGNFGASRNPKVSIRRGDAYRTLLRSTGQFDVIVSEPSNPWVAGVEMLYSREFLSAARDRLTPGGVYAQWFHLYESDVEVVSLVLRTYASVFPRVSVWFTLGSDLLLLGFDRPDRGLDVRALEQRFHRADFAEGFSRAGIEQFPQLLSHELLPLGTLHATELTGPIHTLRKPILSYRAARAFFIGRQAWLPPYLSAEHEEVSSRNSLLQRYSGRGPLSEELLEVAARETCRFDRREECAALLARWSVDHPGSSRFESTLEDLRKDTGGKMPEIQKGRLAMLRPLYGAKLPVAKKAAVLAQAQALTTRFARFYHHAVPFDRRILEAVWGRCQMKGCEENRRKAEDRLGELRAVPVRGDEFPPSRRAAAREPESTETASPAPDAGATRHPGSQ